MFKSTIVEIIKSYNHNRPPFTEYLRGRGKQYLLLSEYLFVGNMTMTSFPGSTFSWQSKIYTYAFIYYNLHPVPKGGGGLGSSVPVPLLSLPRLPHRPSSLLSSSTCILMAALHLVTSIILHLPPANSHGVTSNHQKVLPLCYFLSCYTHNRLIFSFISPWVLTPQGSHA